MATFTLDGLGAKRFTQVVDHVRFFFVCVFLTAVLATDRASKELIPWRAAMIPGVLVASHVSMEIIYGSILGPNTLSEVKRQQLQKDINNPQLLWFLATLVLQLCAAVGVLAHLGCFAPLLVEDFTSVSSWTLAYLLAYAEFWALTILKDATSMHFIHRWMHNQNNAYFHKIHQQHHTYEANLNIINGALIDPVDLFFENTIGPVLMVAAKALLGLPARVSILAFLINLSAEGSNHSLNPYSIGYYFPPIDAVMKGNIAHNLHHVKKYSNLHGHPWHHWTRGYRSDLKAYNQCMKTRVEF